MVAYDRAASLLLLVVLSACKDSEAKPRTDLLQLRLPVAQVRIADIPEVQSVPGTVVSDARIELSSRVVGFIQSLDVREGRRVAKGDVLVRIDPNDIDEAMRQAQAGVAMARDDLSDAEHDVEKYTGLVERGAATAEVLRKAKVRRDIARSAVARAEAAFSAAQAQRAYANVVSPVDGIVVALQKHSGDMATAGAPILTVESREVLLFRIFVSEGNLGRIKPDMAVMVRIDALAGREVQGTVQRIVPSGDPVTRRYEVMVALPPDPALLPGMFGRAEIVLGTTPAPVVPRDSMVQRGGLDGVFVVGKDNTIRFRWLRTGREWNSLVEVTSGLLGGEAILARSDDNVRDGAAILAEDGKND